MREFLRRLDWMFRRKEYELDLDEEMRHHLALKAEESGDTSAAKRQFGNIALLKENSRAMWTFTFWEQFAQDLRYGLRTMAGNKLFTAMAVLSLALGIGANTAIYSFMHAILLRSLPVQHPEQLVILNWRSTGRAEVVHSLNGTMHRSGSVGSESPDFPFAAYQRLRENKDIVSTLFAYAHAYELNLTARNQAEVARGLYVSGNFSSGLGLVPAAGRMVGDEDDITAGGQVAAISYEYWQRRFSLDPGAIGQTILINNHPFTVIGVAPAGFYGVDSSFKPAVFLPLHVYPIFSAKPVEEEQRRFANPNFYWVEMMGRLRPGVTRSQAQATFGWIFHNYVDATAVTQKEKKNLPALWVENGAGGLDSLRRQFSKPLYVLMGMVGLILVITCANIANLLLARATARRREIAIRLSLGAGRVRVIRQLLTESVLMSVCGGALGLLIAAWGIQSITWLLSDWREGVVLGAKLNLPVLAFTAGISVLTGIVFGLAPAFRATSGNVSPALKEARIGRTVRRGIGLSQALVVSQIAISLLLVIGAGFFVRTLRNLHAVDVGFNREKLLIFSVNARQAGYKDDEVARFYGQLAGLFRGIPGVRSASFSDLPLVAGYWNEEGLTIPGVPPPSGKKPSTALLSVDESFLATMQIPLLLGRGIENRDILSPRVLVVNELFARKFFPGRSPVGQHIGIGHSEDLEIVGVVKTALYNSLKEETPPLAYVPYTRDPAGLHGVWFALRTAGNPLAAAPAVRRIVQEAGPRIPVTNMKTQAAQIDQTIAQERTFADLCTCFAALALLIACVGLYGTMAYAVARRTSEVGIRMALGAQRGKILWMMLRPVFVLTVTGIAIGLTAASQTTHFVTSFLFGVKAGDPVTMWGSAGMLFAAALAAGYGPARRATRVDPVVALRNE